MVLTKYIDTAGSIHTLAHSFYTTCVCNDYTLTAGNVTYTSSDLVMRIELVRERKSETPVLTHSHFVCSINSHYSYTLFMLLSDQLAAFLYLINLKDLSVLSCSLCSAW